MNDKIKQIAEQANIKYGVRDDTYYSSSYDGVRRSDMEEFAKLVILEYKREEKESRREIKSKLGYSRIGLNNV